MLTLDTNYGFHELNH